MKTLILACLLSAGIAGAYAQTNNNTGVSPDKNTPATVTPDNNGTPAAPDNRGTANDGVIKNKPQNTDTTTYKNPVTNPEYKTDPRNENEKPNGPNPTGKTTTPASKKTSKQSAAPKPGN
jgi:hypothetical protein